MQNENKKKATNKKRGGSKSSTIGRPKPKKFRSKNPETGKIKYVTAKEAAAIRNKFFKSKSESFKYEQIKTNEDIQKLGRIRYKGRFISKKAEESILKFSKNLDQKNVDYNLKELLEVPEIESKILVVTDVTPKEQFYWNLQNMIEGKKFGNEIKIKIIGFDGTVIYNGKSAKVATEIMEAQNRKIEALEKIIELKEHTNAYFTIPVYETTVGTDIVALEIDLKDLQGRLPDATIENYKNHLF